MSPQEVFPGVWEWSLYSAAHRVDLTSHAIAHAGGWIVVDPTGSPADWSSGPVQAVVLTGGNHPRSAAEWSQAWGAELWEPAGAESGLAGARRFGPGPGPFAGWEAVGLPGGGPAETAFRIPALDLVIFGDAVVNLPGRSLELLPDKYCSDPLQLREGLRRLVATPFGRAVFAHGPALVTEASVRVAALL